MGSDHMFVPLHTINFKMQIDFHLLVTFCALSDFTDMNNNEKKKGEMLQHTRLKFQPRSVTSSAF
jgi:hypothetical protein